METKPAPDHLTDYRMVKLSDGTLLVGSVVVEGEFLRIENALELTTVAAAEPSNKFKVVKNIIKTQNW